ncbi:hypothetical protein AKJ09_04997 [Labilithrix luteola]|uniref:Uncharacterized protein n=1 Tax=Labilithrix luteola TaxID=1391654 RepID=A0A0K1PXT4_9BACT|nr:hypothetical protein AKJ09_04997 [Labilithrix luteola]
MLNHGPQCFAWRTSPAWHPAVTDSSKVSDPSFGASVTTVKHGHLRHGSDLQWLRGRTRRFDGFAKSFLDLLRPLPGSDRNVEGGPISTFDHNSTVGLCPSKLCGDGGDLGIRNEPLEPPKPRHRKAVLADVQSCRELTANRHNEEEWDDHQRQDPRRQDLQQDEDARNQQEDNAKHRSCWCDASYHDPELPTLHRPTSDHRMVSAKGTSPFDVVPLAWDESSAIAVSSMPSSPTWRHVSSSNGCVSHARSGYRSMSGSRNRLRNVATSQPR